MKENGGESLQAQPEHKRVVDSGHRFWRQNMAFNKMPDFGSEEVIK
jgi:hypothetical protein